MARLAVPDDVLSICATLHGAGWAAYVVGGGVRDALLGRVPNDWDVATDAPPDEVRRLFPRTVATGLAFGTVTVLVDAAATGAKGEAFVAAAPGRGKGSGGVRAVEVTTFRGEAGYADGRRPDVVHFIGSIEEDLIRRDFTVNAIAYDPERGRLVDPHDGQGDLRRRLLRAVGDPDARFEEDGLRVLRAIRLATELAFDIEQKTAEALRRHGPALRRISRERIGDEWRRLLASDEPGRGLGLLHGHGLLPHVIGVAPDADVDTVTAALDRIQRPHVETPAKEEEALISRTALVLRGLSVPDRYDKCLRTLVYPKRIGRPAQAVARLLDDVGCLPRVSGGALRRRLGALGRPLIPVFLAVHRAWCPSVAAAVWREQIGRIVAAGDALTTRDLALGGQDVQRILAIGPSARVGELLDRLLEHVLHHPKDNTPKRLEELLRQWHEGRDLRNDQ